MKDESKKDFSPLCASASLTGGGPRGGHVSPVWRWRPPTCPYCVVPRQLTCAIFNYREADKEKKAEAARKKAERDSLLAAEEASLPSRAEPKKSKAPAKKSRGLDLSQLDDAPASAGGRGAPASLNATGIDNALDALSLTADNKGSKVERHPERRYPAAYAKYEARRLNEMDEDGTGAGLRQNQKKERIRKEFEKSPENPFNQVTARYDASKDELQTIRDQEKDKIEKRLGSKS